MVLIKCLLFSINNKRHTIHNHFDLALHLFVLYNDKSAARGDSHFDVFNDRTFDKFHSARFWTFLGKFIQIKGHNTFLLIIIITLIIISIYREL